MRLELLPLYWAIAQKFRDILIALNFVVFTDNNPLSYLQTTAKLGTDPTTARLEGITSEDTQVRNQVVGTPLPMCVTSFVEDSSETLVQESRARPKHVPPKGTTTFPSFPKKDLAVMQSNDESISRLWHYWKSKHPPTLRLLMKEEKPALKLLRDWKRIREEEGV